MVFQDVLKTSLSRLARCLWNVFKTSWKTKNCYAEDVLKTSSRHVLKTSSTRLEDQQMFPELCPYYKALWSKSKKLLTLRKINSFYILNGTIRIEINENNSSLWITVLMNLKNIFLILPCHHLDRTEPVKLFTFILSLLCPITIA